MERNLKKIVFTGAPSSGKSTAIEALNCFSEKLVIVPETASLLLAGGYPPPEIGNLNQVRTFQKIILDLQENLEEMFAYKNPKAAHMILDRAILDGVGYWPKGPEAFLKEFKINVNAVLDRYGFVIFFEMPPKKYFGGVHLKRFHDYQQSKEIGEKQFSIWKQHKNFIKIPSYDDFSQKIKHVVDVVEEIIDA